MRKRFRVMIECENAAFDQDAAPVEIARILREAAATLDLWNGLAPGDSARLVDSNGNWVGHWQMVEERS